MARPNRFQIMQHVKPRIVGHFSKLGHRIYTLLSLAEVLREKRDAWTLPNNTTPMELSNFLVEKRILRDVLITLPKKKLTKYLFGEVSDFEIALSIKKDSYLSHYSAVFLHQLTESVPKTIYTNVEQKMKGAGGGTKLEQRNVDLAFSRPMRQTNQVARMGDLNIVLLNGKNVERIGVKEFDFGGRPVFSTDMERTLIDIAVRPNYAGGVHEVLDAYIAAKGRVSVNRLTAFLKKMDYTYPYHQAIGFYLERAGYDDGAVALLREFPREIDFHLTYQMRETDYCKDWRLFIPKGF